MELVNNPRGSVGCKTFCHKVETSLWISWIALSQREESRKVWRGEAWGWEEENAARELEGGGDVEERGSLLLLGG